MVSLYHFKYKYIFIILTIAYFKGAGIIGVSTAYYLTRHPKFSPSTHHITILESKRVAGGASGKAGGLLALWAFPQQLVPMSFQLHQDLADEYNGEKEWGYRRLTTVSIEANIDSNHHNHRHHLHHYTHEELDTDYSSDSYDSSFQHHVESMNNNNNNINNKKGKTKKSTGSTRIPKGPQLPPDLNWIKNDIIEGCSSLGGTDSTAQVHPYKFTNFLLKKAMETGSVDLIIGKVLTINYNNDNGSAESVTYIPSTSKEVLNSSSFNFKTLNASKFIMTVGPWTSKILPDCPISGLRAHSITISTPHNVSPYAIFTELKISRGQYVSPEIYSRPDEVYVCGEGDTLVGVPETTDDVEVIHEKCDELFNYAKKISKELESGTVLKRQACYLPVLDVPSASGPLIGKTNVENLYLASGHSCWGINNAPGTGKVMAELILDGEATSADISLLDPELYFDASVNF